MTARVPITAANNIPSDAPASSMVSRVAGQTYNWGKAFDIPRTFPAAPSVSLVHGESQLKVIWDKPDERGATITEFVVQYKKAADSTWQEHSRPEADKTTTDITGLENGVFDDVRVRAVNSVTLDDEGGYVWDKESETPRTIPGPVTGLRIISGNEGCSYTCQAAFSSIWLGFWMAE